MSTLSVDLERRLLVEPVDRDDRGQLARLDQMLEHPHQLCGEAAVAGEEIASSGDRSRSHRGRIGPLP